MAQHIQLAVAWAHTAVAVDCRTHMWLAAVLCALMTAECNSARFFNLDLDWSDFCAHAWQSMSWAITVYISHSCADNVSLL